MTISKTADAAVNAAEEFVRKGYHYIYGYKNYMNPVTQKGIQALAAQNPSNFTADYTAKALNFVYSNAIDCSGLVCAALGISDIGSYSIHDLPRSHPEAFTYVSGPAKGVIAWKQGHVGLCTGEVWAVEARSMAAGVDYFRISSQPWKEWIMPKYLDTESHKPGWHREPDGKYWYATGPNRGEYYHSGMYIIDGNQYMFDEEGYLLKEKIYLTDSDGAMTKVVNTRYYG